MATRQPPTGPYRRRRLGRGARGSRPGPAKPAVVAETAAEVATCLLGWRRDANLSPCLFHSSRVTQEVPVATGLKA